MTNRDVLTYERTLAEVNLRGLDINYIISVNQELATNEAKHIRKGAEPSEKVKEFQNKLRDIQFKYARKNAEGDVITKKVNINGNSTTIPDIESFNDSEGEYAKAFAQLRSEYNVDLIKYEEILENFDKLLDKNNTRFKPLIIDYSMIPDDISSADMRKIYPFINKTSIPKHIK